MSSYRHITEDPLLLPSRLLITEALFQDVIDQIKQLMTAASKELLTASRHRAFFRQVKILLPRTWTSVNYDQTLQGETYEDAEIRVDR